MTGWSLYAIPYVTRKRVIDRRGRFRHCAAAVPVRHPGSVSLRMYWNPGTAIMMPTLSSLVAPEVVVATISGATSDDKIAITTIHDVLIWKRPLHYWLFGRGGSSYKRPVEWTALMFSLLLACTVWLGGETRRLSAHVTSPLCPGFSVSVHLQRLCTRTHCCDEVRVSPHIDRRSIRIDGTARAFTAPPSHALWRPVATMECKSAYDQAARMLSTVCWGPPRYWFRPRSGHLGRGIRTMKGCYGVRQGGLWHLWTSTGGRLSTCIDLGIHARKGSG